MTGKFWLAAAAAAVAAVMAGQPARADEAGVKAGFLTCNVSSGWGFVFGATRDLNCTYADNNGSTERYAGHINDFGVDIGYIHGGVVAWAVLAPTANIGKGALAGTFVGVTAGATPGVGGNASVLVGGSDKSISLQPLSIQGNVGLNVAAGVASIVLQAAE